jgi:hypothetical protein
MRIYTFDSTNPYWEKNFDYDMLFLHAQQNYFNDKLQADGFVLFTDVLTHLGFPVDDSIDEDLKWVLTERDCYVDFGIEGDFNTCVFELLFDIPEDKTCEKCEYRDLHGLTTPCTDCQKGEEWQPRVDMYLRAYGGLT